MTLKFAFWGAICAVVFLSGTLSAQAQNQTQAPRGSCLMPSGDWCWPLTKAPIGHFCECVTSNGVVAGSMR
jgi:hypothetical protein